MGRKRNKKKGTSNQTFQEAEIVRQFTNMYWDMNKYIDNFDDYYGKNVYTPDTLRELMVDLTNNTIPTTPENVSKALKSVPYSAEALQGLVEFMEYVDMTFKKVVEYFSGLLSFDLQHSVRDATAKDFKSKEYKEDLAIVNNFLAEFDYIDEFRKVLREVLRNEVSYVWYREDSNTGRNALQLLPQRYCLLTGYTPYGLLFDFDMNYFLLPSVDIDTYAPVFKKYFRNTFQDIEKHQEEYIPSNPLDNRDGTFAQFTQTSPLDGAWAFKLDNSNYATVPYLAALMQDTVLNTVMRDIQENKNLLGSLALIIGEMKLLDNQKVGNVRDAFAIEPETMGALFSMLRSSLNPNIKIGATPSYENKWFQYKDDNTSMYENQLKISSGLGVSSARMIYSNDKMSQAEIENSVYTDYNIVKKIYEQFNKFLEFNINLKTKKYKFNFSFNGCSYPFERDYRIERILELADRGIVLNESAFASAFGYRPHEFTQMLQEGHSGGFVDRLSSLVSIHTSSNADGSKGRPKKKGVVRSASREYDNK